VVRSRPARFLRAAPAALQRPVPISRWRVPSSGSAYDEASSRIHLRSPVRSSPAGNPWMEQGSLGLSPGFAPRGYPRRTPRRGRSLRTGPDTTSATSRRTSFDECRCTHATCVSHDLVQPAGVDRQVHQCGARPGGAHPGDRGAPGVRGAVVDYPEHPLGPSGAIPVLGAMRPIRWARWTS
jgi:hypothetical protein